MRPWSLLLLAALLVACAGETHRAPVEDRNAPRIHKQVSDPHPAVAEANRPPPPVTNLPPRTYTVAGGDTLYSIAWRYGFEHAALARANGIAKPYTIFPGQALKLTDEAPPAPSVKKRTTTQAIPAPGKSTVETGVAVVQKAKPAAKNTSPKAVKTTSPSTKKSAAVGGGPIRWRWPTEGRVVRGFSGTVHKGIDIDGQEGDRVSAVADGSVVYAGSGIVGYGKLLIVKHNDVYLSAYGHNNSLLVAEGDAVKAGQKIAEKGSSATNSVKLHFEIRREGKPVDPKKLLPRR